MSESNAHSTRINPLKLVIGLGLDYLRWTQLAPLITVWLFALAMVAAILVVENLDAIFDAIDSVLRWVSGLPVIGEALLAKMEAMAGEDGRIDLGGQELKAAVLRVWSMASLTFMVLALLVRWFFGPFNPWSLKRKLATVGIACAVWSMAVIGAFALTQGDLEGEGARMFLTFMLQGLVLFAVNAWFVSIAHFIGRVRRLIDASSLGERADAGRTAVVDK